MQVYGDFEGVPLQCLVWVGNIMTPVIGSFFFQGGEAFNMV